MKIIYAIVGSDDGNRVTDVLTEHKFSVTRLSTTGGFLKKGNATLMIGLTPNPDGVIPQGDVTRLQKWGAEI